MAAYAKLLGQCIGNDKGKAEMVCQCTQYFPVILSMYPLEQKSAVSFAPIGNPNIMPIMYVKSMICFWGMFCSTFVEIIRLDKIVNINRSGNIWLNHSIMPALAHVLTCAGNNM